MNELIKPLAKILDISASELEKIVSSLNMNAPQIYERLLHEWQWYRFLQSISWLGALVIPLLFILLWAFTSLEVAIDFNNDVTREKAVLKNTSILTAVIIVVWCITRALIPILSPHIDMIMQLK
ncbi:hypothetical protein [Streptococcus parauberis]|uniref:Uncharacterized protein n=1 Tax=Streptococcus parauberis NCFD 2020 TaxID=873447 RepID=F1Z0P7_9STRE|nr:hypothetical protein [Streptococcus parauberis]EGE53485.1 hypothetical protein SPB_0691 [Streptococcus parauberis NCFD 2020]